MSFDLFYNTNLSLTKLIVTSILLSIVLILSGVVYMKIRKGGKPPKDPRAVYGCSECGEYFTSPEILSSHCVEIHKITLSGEDCKKLQYDVTPIKYKEMLDHELEHEKEQDKISCENSERAGAKLSNDLASDPGQIMKCTDLDNPDAVFKKLSDLLESSDTSKPLPGIFKINIEGAQIKLIVALNLQNTPENMSAISEFNSMIS